jgi:hypothetical protein
MPLPNPHGPRRPRRADLRVTNRRAAGIDVHAATHCVPVPAGSATTEPILPWPPLAGPAAPLRRRLLIAVSRQSGNDSAAARYVRTDGGLERQGVLPASPFLPSNETTPNG